MGSLRFMSPATPSWSVCWSCCCAVKIFPLLQATDLMQAWLSESLTPVQTGAFLAGLRAKGMEAEELAAMAAVLREALPAALCQA